MKSSTRSLFVVILTFATCATVARDLALASALLAAATVLAGCWRPPVRAHGGRTVARRIPLPGAARAAAKPSGYSAAAVVAFARATPALLVAVSDRPAGWLDGITKSDRRTLAAAGVLHVDQRAGLTLTAAGYSLASKL